MKFIKDLKEGDRESDIYLCKHKQSAVTKNGKAYDNVILQDKTGTIDAKVWEPSPVNNVERALTEVRCLQSLHKDTKISSYLQICIIRMCGFPISSLHRCMYNWCVIGVQREWYANNGGRNYGVMSGHIPHARCLRICSGCKVRYTFRAMQ